MTYLVLAYAFATLMLGGFLAVSLLQLGGGGTRERRGIRWPGALDARRRRGPEGAHPEDA